MQAQEGVAVGRGCTEQGRLQSGLSNGVPQGLGGCVRGQGWGILWHSDRQCCKKNELVHRPDHLLVASPWSLLSGPLASLCPPASPGSAGLCSRPLSGQQAVSRKQPVSGEQMVSGAYRCLISS